MTSLVPRTMHTRLLHDQQEMEGIVNKLGGVSVTISQLFSSGDDDTAKVQSFIVIPIIPFMI